MEVQGDPYRAGHWLGDEMLERAERILSVIDDSPHTPIEVAFAWILSHQVVSSVIAGASTEAQVLMNASTSDVDLDRGLLKALSEASLVAHL
jgi:aryl-alcohol dehydrogenase-like predicted oxidoreductase